MLMFNLKLNLATKIGPLNFWDNPKVHQCYKITLYCHESIQDEVYLIYHDIKTYYIASNIFFLKTKH